MYSDTNTNLKNIVEKTSQTITNLNDETETKTKKIDNQNLFYLIGESYFIEDTE